MNDLAAGFGQSGEGVALLLVRGANPNAQNKMGLTARQEVCSLNSIKLSITRPGVKQCQSTLSYKRAVDRYPIL